MLTIYRRHLPTERCCHVQLIVINTRG